jgi:PPIC-type PPIASE domain
VVIKVGNVQLTQAEFESVVSTLEAQQGPADLTRQAIGENYASLLMLSQQAVAHHLDTSPEVIRQLAIDRTQILSNAEFASLKAEAKPTAEQIRAYYSAHLDDYDVVLVRRIFIWKTIKGSPGGPGMSSADAHALADAIRQAYASGSDPRKLIKDPNSVVLDTEPLNFQRGELPEKMAKAAFTIKEGEWAVLDDTSDALVLLQLLKRSPRDLKEMSPSIEKKLQAEKLQAKLDNLKKQNGVWLDQAYFAPVPPRSSSSTQTSGPMNSVQKEKDDKRQK